MVPPPSDPVGPVLPAAATMTASLSTAAYRSAAPSAAWSTGRSAGRQVIAEMLITRAPRSAACTMARPSAATSMDACASSGSPPGVRGENLADVTRSTAPAPRARPPRNRRHRVWPAMRPATSVPCPSQSVRPSVDSTKSPPACDVGQPRTGPHPGVDDRYQLAFAAGKLPRRRKIQHRLTGRRRRPDRCPG